jgi:hypothetical protein
LRAAHLPAVKQQNLHPDVRRGQQASRVSLAMFLAEALSGTMPCQQAGSLPQHFLRNAIC